jgi:hypothetical protein
MVAWLYTSVIRPILAYASLVWWKRVELKNAQKRLSHLQRMTCLGIIGGMRSRSKVCFRGYVHVATLTFFHCRYEIFCRFPYKRGLGQCWCRCILSHFECQGIICLRLLSYSLSIQSILCYFGVFGILHFERHYQQSIVILL